MNPNVWLLALYNIVSQWEGQQMAIPKHVMDLITRLQGELEEHEVIARVSTEQEAKVDTLTKELWFNLCSVSEVKRSW